MQPDVVLLDLATPEMIGAEMAKALAQRCPRLPIMVMGYAGRTALPAAFGPMSMLSRHFVPDVLLARLPWLMQHASAAK